MLDSFHTGNIPALTTVTWVQYGFYFSLPPGVDTVVLRMTNNASGGDGNDLALDDITFRAAGPLVQPSVAGYPTDTVTFCQPNVTALGFSAAVENCYPTAAYQWQQSVDSGVSWTDIAGATSATYNLPPAGPGYDEYRLTVAQAGNIGLSSCEVAVAADIGQCHRYAVAGGDDRRQYGQQLCGDAGAIHGYAGQRGAGPGLSMDGRWGCCRFGRADVYDVRIKQQRCGELYDDE